MSRRAFSSLCVSFFMRSSSSSTCVRINRLVTSSRRVMLDISTAFPLAMADSVLIEGKGPPGCEQDVREFLYPLAPRISPFSKYFHGCQHLGLVYE